MEPCARVSVWPGRRYVPGIVALGCLGEHAEQNVSLATSPAASLRWSVGVGRSGAPKSVPSFRIRHHGSTPPRERCYPRCAYGVGGFVALIAESRPGFSEQYQFLSPAHPAESHRP